MNPYQPPKAAVADVVPERGLSRAARAVRIAATIGDAGLAVLVLGVPFVLGGWDAGFVTFAFCLSLFACANITAFFSRRRGGAPLVALITINGLLAAFLVFALFDSRPGVALFLVLPPALNVVVLLWTKA